MKTPPNVVRIEQVGEVATPFPTLWDAMREEPQCRESVIATSEHGVVLAEAEPFQASRCHEPALFLWRPTLAGADVLQTTFKRVA